MLCLALAVGCARSSESGAAPFVAPTGVAARVYATVLDSLGLDSLGLDSLGRDSLGRDSLARDALARDSSSGPIVVPESTVVFRAPAGVPATWDEFALVPSGLPTRLEALSGAPQPNARLPLPRPVRVLTAAESEAIRVAQPRDWWGEFRRRNPGQRQVLSFSPIAFTADSTTALVEFVQGCGENCGGGYLVWLERKSGDRWTIRRTYQLWYN